MILKTKEFRNVCSTIKNAVDTKDTSLITETLNLVTSGSNLILTVTNREYVCTCSFPLETVETFNASVNASLFLNLISKVTTDKIELTLENNNVKIKANGEYKLPLIFNNDKMLELPTITINNVTNQMEINSNILHSIADYNSKELLRGVAAKPVQKYYYIDEQGCITFTSGACVNSFTLVKPIKMLLSDKIVKLFRLFKEDSKVDFTMGQDALTEELVQTKVKFVSGNITLTAKLSDSSLVNSVPVSAIRTMANNTYSYSAVVNKANLLEALTRLLLFNETSTYGTLEFTSDKVTIYDYSKDNKEVVTLHNNCPTLQSYSMIVDLSNVKLIFDGIEDEYVTINFGDKKAVVFKKQSISDILPELRVSTN